jgi:hypothetical protein
MNHFVLSVVKQFLTQVSSKNPESNWCCGSMELIVSVGFVLYECALLRRMVGTVYVPHPPVFGCIYLHP